MADLHVLQQRGRREQTGLCTVALCEEGGSLGGGSELCAFLV